MDNPTNSQREHPWLYESLLVLVLAVGLCLRLVGLNWDSNQHLHPDERFLTMVETGLQVKKCADPNSPIEACPPDQQRWISLSDYFDTANSTLNPHNQGFSYFVYGTLPIFVVRYIAEWLGQIGYDQVDLLGRQLSALADLATILLLYLIVARLYGRKTALLAASFSTLAVLQIQQSHFFTVDTWANMFIFMAILCAVRVGEEAYAWRPDEVKTVRGFFRHPLLYWSVGFGVALGMAVASKLNAAPLAILLPGAFLVGMLGETGVLKKSRPESFDRTVWLAIAYLAIGALAALVTFRTFQPYAFSGPGFFGVKPNPAFIANIQEQRAQANGDVDVPFALQWARRSHLFSFKNLTLWGLGLPLGILAWAGFLWMGWRILKGEWRKHILLWGWTALYFLWQSLQFNPTMRYELPIYPLLAMMAAYLVFTLAQRKAWRVKRLNLTKALAVLLGGTVLLTTFAWALAFVHIYQVPHTRVAATRWIYQNVPGPINLQIHQMDGTTYQQPLPFPYQMTIQPGAPFEAAFTAQADGTLSEIDLAHVSAVAAAPHTLLFTISATQNGQSLQLAQATLSGPFTALGQTDNASLTATLPTPPFVQSGETYSLEVQVTDEQAAVDLCGSMRLQLQTNAGLIEQPVELPTECTLRPEAPLEISFVPQADGTLNAIALTHAKDILAASRQNLSLTIAAGPQPTDQTLSSASLTADFSPQSDPRGQGYTLSLDHSLNIVKGQTYFLSLEASAPALTLSGAAPINESSWDDGLPLRMDGYDGFGGLYQGGLNLELYWDDDAEKLARFESTLDQGDYIFMSSNRQWATIPRVPERYPLTTAYYRALIGCPPEQDLIWCYNVAKPGTFQGQLGFDLVQVFDSYPTLNLPGLGTLQINDQSAEEAFTVYDHPKVLIFKKNPNYDPAKVQAILGAVDLSHVVHLTPRQAGHYKSLMLPEDLLATQQAGGTWSHLFNYQWLQNRYPYLGLVIWYVFIFVLGLATYPLMRLAFPGLADHGYPLSRAMGLVLLAYFPWLLGSFGLPFSRVTIGVTFGLLLVVGAVLAIAERDKLRAELKSRGRYYLLIESLFLLFFLIDLSIRIGNPDLWHPAKGGERPMDFSYFNAVLKGTVFPPYDPWFAGGYINYYYYGYVLVGTPVKLLGIVPSIAYNYILPTLFAVVALGAFSLGWNFLNNGQEKTDRGPRSRVYGPLIAGLAAALGLVVLGNLGTVRMIYQALQRMVAPGGVIDPASLLQHIAWGIQGFFKSLGGASLPIGRGDWYWFPSRVIPAPGDVEPITEFPFFTFLYSDLHAHMIVLPLALLSLAWALSIVKSHAKWVGGGAAILSFVFGGLAMGALRPTNTWDMYTYLPIAALAAGYALWRYTDINRERFGFSPGVQRILLGLGGMALLAALSMLFYLPFTKWFGQAYGAVNLWKGSHTPIWSYLTQWSLFLFVIASWMVWETREWLASTPVSALHKLNRYQILIEIGIALLLGGLLALAYLKVQIGWLALPLAVWAGVLILRPGMSDAKRGVLFMVGTGLVLTILVEVIVLRGDVGRMNTVFKLYLQAWVLFALSAGAAFAWLLPELHKWLPSWRNGWQAVGLALLAGTALFTVTATFDKVRDRMAPQAPHTLDSMTYMEYAQYADQGVTMDLSQDYHAIRWMQDNVEGSPVIVETNCPEYRWCTRFTIYTGLPGVVGWNWHQRQRRALLPPDWITERIDEIANFYNTNDPAQAEAFLKKYNVQYIVVGQLEHAYYPGPGLDKFPQYDRRLWNEVYRYQDTVIYKVNP